MSATPRKKVALAKTQTLGALIREQMMADPAKQKQLAEGGGSVAFAYLGEVISAWIAGQTKMVVTGKGTASAAATLKACGKSGYTVAKMPKGRGVDASMDNLSRTIADLSYLLLLGKIAPVKLDYAAPAEKAGAAVLNVSELIARYPKLKVDLPILVEAGRLDPGSVRCPAAIAAVDAGVLILDYVRSSK